MLIKSLLKISVIKRKSVLSQGEILKTRNFMELSGKVIAVLEPRGGVSKTGNPWKVQEYVIETHDQYPRRMCFDVFGEDKINQFNIQLGEELNVSFDVDARE